MVRFNIAFFPALLYYMDKPWIVCGDILGWPAGGSRSQANRRNIMEKIAILRWESGHVPQGLMQLEQLPGNSTNPASYPFPVKLVEVKGANTDTVILHPSQKLLEDMIQLAKELEKKMRQAAVELNFEQAAKLRDRMLEVKKMLQDFE